MPPGPFPGPVPRPVPGVVLLVLLLLLFPVWFRCPAGLAACPHSCLCASDIISCSGSNLSRLPFELPGYATRLDLSHNQLDALPLGWMATPAGRLTTLVLSRNLIGRIEAAAFARTPALVRLDLSSNRLAVLEGSVFAGLDRLEVLLLFENRIARVDPGAFAGLPGLRRLYLSGNRLTAFPLELYRGPGMPARLILLDLSFNRVTRVPVQSLLGLAPQQQGGIYLQGNPLVCDCALSALLEFWVWRKYRPLLDFSAEYSCAPGQDGRGHRPDCTGTLQEAQDPFPGEGAYQIEPGDRLKLPCPGLGVPVQGGPTVFWLAPGRVLSSSDPGGADGRLRVLPNATLEIRGALVQDSGTYACVAARGRRPREEEGVSPEVTVAVGSGPGVAGSGPGSGVAGSGSGSEEGGGRGNGEHFNTAFTTLASCVVSIVLVLLYLYLTPCRCRGDRAGAGPGQGWGGRATLLCSDPREAESGEGRPNGKRVAFLEPQGEESEKSPPKAGEGRPPPSPSRPAPPLHCGEGGGAGDAGGRPPTDPHTTHDVET